MNIPANLKYSKDHEWIRVEGAEAYVGITDFAQNQLGDIVFVDVTTVGETLPQNEVFGTIEAVKTVSRRVPAGRRRDPRIQRSAERRSRSGQQGPLRGGLDREDPDDGPRRAERAARRGRLRQADRLRRRLRGYE